MIKQMKLINKKITQEKLSKEVLIYNKMQRQNLNYIFLIWTILINKPFYLLMKHLKM